MRYDFNFNPSLSISTESKVNPLGLTEGLDGREEAALTGLKGPTVLSEETEDKRFYMFLNERRRGRSSGRVCQVLPFQLKKHQMAYSLRVEIPNIRITNILVSTVS